ncbi:dTDP-4-dehydrorhamnose reductase [Synechococcus sp. CS-197]|uniref:dTDP-4-dehydrorhamnose reductase n=1 Tax=Synechococcus sp. CS-197 TaxID=2847985 RepID=UPI0001525B9A|nr:dTDP-4-dehydrorhamnose reductase [Synechococcus sp. CS-197]MCT0250823.1 dTDP-4-dehydrorhamnose reductase [Synechococcus sp. CS-197]CAK22530.1 putative dTDP-4-dehydrorhamnose reductase [Synechococcus sp. WH 7803]
MKVLLTGAGGQLGQALIAACPPGIELIATRRAELDLADPQACSAAVHHHRPAWVLNAGAYTAVDKAESEPALAQAVNAGAPAALAQALAETGGRMLQLSTDFVFNGAQGQPYQPDQPRDPLGVYGTTKAAGEQAVAEQLGAHEGGRAAILRTSWVYGAVGRNFLLTMLRLHRRNAEAGQPLRVVADQVGCPTATPGLAAACWALIAQNLSGWQHWSDAGAASWYDFAVAIGELAVARGLIPAAAAVQPITTAQYPTPAQRPAYSLLACAATRAQLGLPARHWRQALAEVIACVDA